jgi:hypothetical protein
VKTNLCAAIVLIFGVSLGSCPSYGKTGQKGTANRPTAVVTANTPLPIVTSGPQKIVVRYTNPLHFHYSLQVSSTNISAPTPPTTIAPSASVGGTLPAPSPAQSPQTTSPPSGTPPPPPTIDQQWQAILAKFKDVRDLAFALKQNTDMLLFTASMEQQCYKDRLSFYASFLLDEKTASSLKAFAVANRTEITSGTSSGSASDSCRRKDDTWPFASLQDAEQKIYSVQSLTFDLADAPGFATWRGTAPNGDNYTALNTAITNLLTQVQGLEASSDVAKNFQAAQVYNHFWRVKIEEIAKSEEDIATAYDKLETARAAMQTNPQNADLKAASQAAQNAYDAARQKSPLELTVYVDCTTNWYGRGRTDTITLHYTDITATSPTDQNTQIASSVCLTPGTVSTGIGMSFLQNQQFAFVSGRDPNNPTNTISVIGTTTDQQVTPLYGVQYNIALRDFTNGWGLHAAVGAALGSSSGTANIEPIAGPAISIRHRAFFITPVFQLARRDSLLPGYKIGDPQGNGLTSVPVHTSWKPGFALIFSFSVAQ